MIVEGPYSSLSREVIGLNRSIIYIQVNKFKNGIENVVAHVIVKESYNSPVKRGLTFELIEQMTTCYCNFPTTKKI